MNKLTFINLSVFRWPYRISKKNNILKNWFDIIYTYIFFQLRIVFIPHVQHEISAKFKAATN